MCTSRAGSASAAAMIVARSISGPSLWDLGTGHCDTFDTARFDTFDTA
jgi:hypothetical protein